MKRTLLICSHYPLPETVGTNIRTMNFVRFFKGLGDIDIAYSHTIAGGEEQRGNPVFANEYFLKRKTVKSLRDRCRRWTDIRSRPLPVPTYEEDDEKQLLSLVCTNEYDYIFVRYVVNTWNLFKLAPEYRTRTIVDFDDILSGALCCSDIASAKGVFRRSRLRLNRRFLIQYEKRCLAFGASLFCSDKDRKTVVDGSRGTNAFVVPNIYHNGAFGNYDFGDGFCNLNVLLFVGGLMYRPNIEGITWFVNTVFRKFRREYPAAKLLLVGHSPAREILDLCRGSQGVELYADTPDIKPHYRQCGAVVVPLLTGGGTRIKILEAALAGRPVLSTPLGAEGLDLADGTDLSLFRDAGEFMARYRELLDRHAYDRMVCSAKDAVSSEYSRDRFHGIMKEVIGDIDRRKPAVCVQ